MNINVLEEIPVLLSLMISCERRFKMTSIIYSSYQANLFTSFVKILWNMLANNSHNALGLVL